LKRIRTINLILAIPFLAHAQGGDRDRWFPPSDLMTVGAYYYPEAWPESQWERDIQGVRKLGMEFIHTGEFAWSRLEPEDGHFYFVWLDRNIELASKAVLKVVLCTPSAAPPVWLVRDHPEVLMVDSNRRRAAPVRRGGAHRWALVRADSRWRRRATHVARGCAGVVGVVPAISDRALARCVDYRRSGVA
jgi:hypothetical protein